MQQPSDGETVVLAHYPELARLSAAEGRRTVASALQMDIGLVDETAQALAGERARLWP